MARTPLLRAIQRLAEEHRTADRLGIPPDELRGQRREAAYTRGDFLKRAGVAGAAVAVAGPAAFARPSGSQLALAAADCDRRRRHRRPQRSADARRRGRRQHRLRGEHRGHRRPHALRPLGLLVEPPGLRVLRRADRHRSRDDPRPRRPLRPHGVRPARGTAERHGRHVLLPRRLLPDEPGRQGLPARVPRAEQAVGRGRLPDDVGQLDADRADARPHVGVRLDREVRPRRPQRAVRAAARRRLRGGVRREHDRPGEPEPRLSARVPALARPVLDLRRVGRALPHRRRQPAAARGDRGVAPVRNAEAGLDDAGDPHEPRRLRLDAVRDAGQDADRHRGPGDPLHELRRAAHARLLGRGLRPAQADGDHAARRRPQREAPAPVQQPALERAGLDRQRVHRPRHPEHVGRHARAGRRDRESSSTTRAATTPAATRRRRRTRTPARTRR